MTVDSQLLRDIEQKLQSAGMLQNNEHQHNGAVAPTTIAWPRDGGVGFLTAGENVFDFQNGIFTPADDNGDEQLSGKLDVIQSVHLHMIPAVGMSVEIVAPITGVGRSRDVLPFFVDWQHHYLTHIAAAKLKIWVRLPTAMFLHASDHAELAPIIPEGPVQISSWAYGDQTTTDSYVAAIMRPVAPNPRKGTTSVLSESRAQTDPDGILLLSAQVINSISLQRVIWTVRNTGTNPAEVNIQGSLRSLDAHFMDDPSTGDAYWLGAGEEAIFEVRRPWTFQRLRARSAVSGASTTINGNAKGIVG